MTTLARAVAVVASCNSIRLLRHAWHRASSARASGVEPNSVTEEVPFGAARTKADIHIRMKGWVATSVATTRIPNPGETIIIPKAAVVAAPAAVPYAAQRGRWDSPRSTSAHATTAVLIRAMDTPTAKARFQPRAYAAHSSPARTQTWNARHQTPGEPPLRRRRRARPP